MDKYLEIIKNMHMNAYYIRDKFEQTFTNEDFTSYVNKKIYNNTVQNATLKQYISWIANPDKKALKYAVKLALLFEIDMCTYMFGTLDEKDLGGKFKEIIHNEELKEIDFSIWYMDENIFQEASNSSLKLREIYKDTFLAELEGTTFRGRVVCRNNFDNDLILENNNNKSMFIKLFKSDNKLVDRQLAFGYILKNGDGDLDFPKVSKCIIAKKFTSVHEWLNDHTNWVKGFLKLDAAINSHNAYIESYVNMENLTIIDSINKTLNEGNEYPFYLLDSSNKSTEIEKLDRTHTIDPLIGKAMNQNGDFSTSYVENDYSKKIASYYFNLNKANVHGKKSEFSMFYIDVSLIKFSTSTLYDYGPIVFKCDYKTKMLIEGTIVIEFKNIKGVVFDKHVIIEDFTGTIQFYLPNLDRNLLNSIIEVCFVLRSDLMKTQQGNIDFMNIRFEE